MVCGYDIRRNLEKVRQNLGLCLQHDVLFDTLTVEEHLKFFGSVSGQTLTIIICSLWYTFWNDEIVEISVQGLHCTSEKLNS